MQKVTITGSIQERVGEEEEAQSSVKEGMSEINDINNNQV